MEYVITDISKQPPKPWNDIFYVNVKVKGHDKAISVGKKDPSSLKVGDTLYGHIEETDYTTDKFKPEKRPEQEKPSDSSYWAEKDKRIQSQWAINAALQAYGKNESGVHDDYFADIETYAAKFYEMAGRIADTPPIDPYDRDITDLEEDNG